MGLLPTYTNITCHFISSLGMNCFVAYRLDNFVIGLTNNDPATTTPVFKSSYTVCAQFSGAVAAADNATVICSPSYEKFRFVIVHGSHASVEAICLTEVSVYARSKLQSAINYANTLQMQCYLSNFN